MNRAACLVALVALATLNSVFAGETLAAADTARPAASLPKGITLQPAVKTVKAASVTVETAPAAVAPKAREAAIKAASEKASTVAPAATPAAPLRPDIVQKPAVTPRPGMADTAKVQPIKEGPDPRKDSATARQYKVGDKPFSREEAKHFLSVFAFKAQGKPESTAVNWIYRDGRGAILTYEQDLSEFAYVFDSVPVLDPKEYIPDSLIRNRTEAVLKSILKEKAEHYAFVNYEKTMIQKRDTSLKEGAAAAVPAYYAGRYLRKLDGRFILGDNFQVRLSLGRGGAVNYMSYRSPTVTDSDVKVKVPTREMVQDYLERWAKDRSRLGRQIYPYHPDNLRIRSLKPVKVIESYVLVQEKFRDASSRNGTYLAPRITVLAEAVLYPSQKKIRTPPPVSPVLLHFHFPCTPGAGLCWPDGKQGIQDLPRGDAGPRPKTDPAVPLPKSESGPAKTGPTTN